MSDILQILSQETAKAIGVPPFGPDAQKIHKALLDAAGISRGAIAESLMGLMFSLRPDDGEVGQAWVLELATTAMARAILGGLGPQGDPEPLLDLALNQLRVKVQAAQSATMRRALTLAPGIKTP